MRLETYWAWGVSVGDVNADGRDDVFVSPGMGFPFPIGLDSNMTDDRLDRAPIILTVPEQ
ncbi:MAG: hypothetical protein WCA20_03175 [Candidatus Sulfotelmatobacter sp.]